VTLTDTAKVLWEMNYDRLTADRPGTIGAVTSRAAPHVLRMAMIYALMDGCPKIDAIHLAPSLKLWDASDSCAAYIFGDSTGDPDADRIFSAIRAKPGGLTRKEISVEVFRRHKPKDAIDQALALLIRGNLVVEARVETGGRPAHRYCVFSSE
jgi:hypothetical protein